MLRCDILAPAQIQAFSSIVPYLLGKSLNFAGFFGDSDGCCVGTVFAGAIGEEQAQGACASAATDDTHRLPPAARLRARIGINLA
jgi:hypothetical protein